jgi:hypothetical protein
MQVFQLVDEHATSTPVGSANEDSNSEISRDTQGSMAEQGYCATVGLRGVAHGDGNDEPSYDTLCHQNTNYLH